MYLALYRKWRPASFDEVYGQPHITKTLKTEVATGRISHAYLFTGSRGTGKTSCAKILAKAVNCLHPVDGNPCNECEICRGIDNGSLTDVVEMDAASNNGVEEIRSLRDEVIYSPTVAKYRVYIVDEVHMLTQYAFNALLKTLEEPPEHVIFILATTDVHKVLPTILSRCQRFDFRRISSADIIRRLNVICERENITLTDDAANLIANIADGGMRDAISILDRCLAISDKITAEVVSSAAGVTSAENLFKFSSFIARSDFKSALLLVSELYANYCDVSVLSMRLLDHFRNIMVAKSVSNCADLIICSEDELASYRKRADEMSMAKILECIDILSKINNSVKEASNKRILLESALIKMCGVRDSELPQRTAPAEDKSPGPVVPVMPKKEPAPIAAPAPEEDDTPPWEEAPAPEVKEDAPVSAETAPPPAAIPANDSGEYPDGPFGLWPEIKENLKNHDMALFAVLSETSAIIKNGKIVIQTSNAGLKDYIVSNNYASALKKSITDITGREMKAAVAVTGAEEKPEPDKDESPLSGLLSKINDFNN